MTDLHQGGQRLMAGPASVAAAARILLVDWAPGVAHPDIAAMRACIIDALTREGRRVHLSRRLLSPVPKSPDTAWRTADRTPPDARTRDQRAALSQSDQMLAEVEDADAVVLSLCVDDTRCLDAFYTWIDLLSRRGLTVSVDTGAPTECLQGHRVILGRLSRRMAPAPSAWACLAVLQHRLGSVGFTQVEMMKSGVRGALRRGDHPRLVAGPS